MREEPALSMDESEPIHQHAITEREYLRRAFQGTPSVFELLRTVRSRRVGQGYRIDSGTTDPHPVTGRLMAQESGPNRFVSEEPPVRLTELEEALLAWAACGPNGIVTWDISFDGGFNQLVHAAGRTAPEPNNSHATDLLIINDQGVSLYRPDLTRAETVLMDGEGDNRLDSILDWYRSGRTQILPHRPDVDWAMRKPALPFSPLNGPHQFNMNLPGTTWFLPITDVARLHNGIVDLFATRHVYLVDDFAGDRPAGVERWRESGRLERPLPLSVYEQGVLQAETYPAGCIVQNLRLAAEALGLGTWCFSGHDSEILMGVHPDLASGLKFQYEPENHRVPMASGRRQIFGLPGVIEATYVPSPGFPDAATLVSYWREARYGASTWTDSGPGNLVSRGQSPWSVHRADELRTHPRAFVDDWAWDATAAFIGYCVDVYGQWPVTYCSLQCGFGVVVHHVDPAFYDRHYRPGYITDRIKSHFDDWH